MINQILPLLLTESTRQGIAKHNAMETVLTRHLRLNRRKLMKSQAQEQVEDIIVDQTVMCLAQYADKNSLRDIEALDIDNMVYAFDSSHASCLLHDA